MTAFLIWWHKGRMRSAYQSYIAKVDRLACGKRMADSLPSVAKLKAKANKHLVALKKLDPTCPLKTLE